MKPIFLLTLTFLLALETPCAFAENKLELSAGYFSLTGKTSTSNGSKSGLGSYRIGYRRRILSNLDLGVGYSLLYSSIFSGDAAFGLDVGATYFPFSYGGQETFERNGQRVILRQDLRPFIGASFSQRSIQSVQMNYSGFGLFIGAEKSMNERTSLKLTLRQTGLNGSRNASASITDVLMGIVWAF